MTKNILRTFALDIADRVHKAVDAHEKGDTEKAVELLNEAKAMHQDLHYKIWREHHISGVVS